MHTYVTSKLKTVWNEVIADANKAGIDYDNIVSVDFDNAQKRLGCCHTRDGFFYITVSKYLKPECIKNVLMHELCHATFKSNQHDKVWQARAQKANSIGYNISRTGSYSELAETPKYKYKVFCENCGQSFMRVRESKIIKYPGSFKCGICGGSFIVKHL